MGKTSLMNKNSLLLVLLCFTGNSFADETLCARFKTFAESATILSPVGFKLESDWSNISVKEPREESFYS